MKAIEFIVLMAVVIGLTLIFGVWGFIGGFIVAILVATGKIKTGFEPKDSPKHETSDNNKKISKK